MEQGTLNILFFCLFFIFMRLGDEARQHLVQMYPTILSSNRLYLHKKVYIIIKAEEGLSHQFFQREEQVIAL